MRRTRGPEGSAKHSQSLWTVSDTGYANCLRTGPKSNQRQALHSQWMAPASIIFMSREFRRCEAVA